MLYGRGLERNGRIRRREDTIRNLLIGVEEGFL